MSTVSDDARSRVRCPIRYVGRFTNFLFDTTVIEIGGRTSRTSICFRRPRFSVRRRYLVDIRRANTDRGTVRTCSRSLICVPGRSCKTWITVGQNVRVVYLYGPRGRPRTIRYEPVRDVYRVISCRNGWVGTGHGGGKRKRSNRRRTGRERYPILSFVSGFRSVETLSSLDRRNRYAPVRQNERKSFVSSGPISATLSPACVHSNRRSRLNRPAAVRRDSWLDKPDSFRRPGRLSRGKPPRLVRSRFVQKNLISRTFRIKRARRKTKKTKNKPSTPYYYYTTFDTSIFSSKSPGREYKGSKTRPYVYIVLWRQPGVKSLTQFFDVARYGMTDRNGRNNIYISRACIVETIYLRDGVRIKDKSNKSPPFGSENGRPGTFRDLSLFPRWKLPFSRSVSLRYAFGFPT